MSLVYLVDAPGWFLLPIAVFLDIRSLCGGSCPFCLGFFVLDGSQIGFHQIMLVVVIDLFIFYIWLSRVAF